MELPHGYEKEFQVQKGDSTGGPTRDTYCVKLKKTIYGLKQSPRERYGYLTSYLQSKGLHSCPFDPYVFTNIATNTGSDSRKYIVLAVYVDDINLYGSNEVMAIATQHLKDRFQLSEASKLHYLLGIQIIQSRDGNNNVISLSQGWYINKVLQRFGMEDCNPSQIPLSPNYGLRKWKDGDIAVDQNLYQQIIGCLIYLVTGTRPDLAYSTILVFQYSSQPNSKHMGAAKRVLRYLHIT